MSDNGGILDYIITSKKRKGITNCNFSSSAHLLKGCFEVLSRTGKVRLQKRSACCLDD
jgi:hypothetical protein